MEACKNKCKNAEAKKKNSKTTVKPIDKATKPPEKKKKLGCPERFEDLDTSVSENEYRRYYIDHKDCPFYKDKVDCEAPVNTLRLIYDHEHREDLRHCTLHWKNGYGPETFLSV